MRVRILRRPLHAYGVDPDSLRVGRVYNLDAALASALMADGCAELYDALPNEQKITRGPREWWQATGRNAARGTVLGPSSTKNIES